MQLTNNEDGIPSGPAAELVDSSCIASIIIFSDNTILVKYNSYITLCPTLWPYVPHCGLISHIEMKRISK